MRARLVFPCLAIVVIARTALAQGGDPAAAERLFQDARSALVAGNYDAACPMFAESYRLDPAPGTMLNLADCEERRGQLARAWQHFRRLYDVLPASDERRAEAKLRADAVEPRIPRLRVVVASAAATVVRDGVTLGPASLGIRLPVDPGKHVIVVTAKGHRERVYEVSLTEGDDKDLSVTTGEPIEAAEPIDVRPDAVAPQVPTSPPGNAQWTAGWVVGGAGVGAIVTGGALGIASLVKLSSANQACSGNVCADAAAVSKYQSAQALALATDVTLGVGVILLGTAVVLLLTAPRSAAAVLAHVSLTSIGGSW